MMADISLLISKQQPVLMNQQIGDGNLWQTIVTEVPSTVWFAQRARQNEQCRRGPFRLVLRSTVD